MAGGTIKFLFGKHLSLAYDSLSRIKLCTPYNLVGVFFAVMAQLCDMVAAERRTPVALIKKTYESRLNYFVV